MFGHFADERDAHEPFLRDSQGWTYAELVDVIGGRPVYRPLDSAGREHEMPYDLGPCDPIDDDEDALGLALALGIAEDAPDDDALAAELVEQAAALGWASRSLGEVHAEHLARTIRDALA